MSSPEPAEPLPKRKYEFTGETKTLECGTVVRQIRRVSDGAIGGWIESDANLSHEGKAWIYPDVVVCRKATIINGTFWGGEFRGGTFWGGTFEGGTFEGGEFWGGTFEGGEFSGGTFEGGEFWGGEFRGGGFLGGTFWGGTFEGGTFWGGTFEGGTFWGGEFRGGTFEGGEFWGGEFWGGEFMGGTFWGGTFEGGTFRGGTYKTSFDFLVVQGLPYQATIQNDGKMSIGCTTKTFAEWRAIEFEQQDEMNREQFDRTRAVLVPLLDLMEAWTAAKTAESATTNQ